MPGYFAADGNAAETSAKSGNKWRVHFATDKTGRDIRGKGRLEYVNKHHLRFAGTGKYFMKGGADSPENFLAYNDFDDMPNNKGLRKIWKCPKVWGIIPSLR